MRLPLPLLLIRLVSDEAIIVPFIAIMLTGVDFEQMIKQAY
jgi:hypothetical protein